METLADRIAQDGPINELDAVGWAIRLAKRLEALHALGVVHGSVSPSCVLTAGTERHCRAVLADVRRTTASPVFQSPERVMGGSLSTADDTWAVASTLYAALTGSAPFIGTDEADTRQRILAATPAPLAVFDVGDDDLQQILDNAFARELPHRTAGVAALRRALEGWHPDPMVKDLPALEDDDDSTDAGGLGDDDDDDDNEATMMKAAPADIHEILRAAQAKPRNAAAIAGLLPDAEEGEEDAKTVMRPLDDLPKKNERPRPAAGAPAAGSPAPRGLAGIAAGRADAPLTPMSASTPIATGTPAQRPQQPHAVMGPPSSGRMDLSAIGPHGTQPGVLNVAAVMQAHVQAQGPASGTAQVGSSLHDGIHDEESGDEQRTVLRPGLDDDDEEEELRTVMREAPVIPGWARQGPPPAPPAPPQAPQQQQHVGGPASEPAGAPTMALQINEMMPGAFPLPNHPGHPLGTSMTPAQGWPTSPLQATPQNILDERSSQSGSHDHGRPDPSISGPTPVPGTMPLGADGSFAGQPPQDPNAGPAFGTPMSPQQLQQYLANTASAGQQPPAPPPQAMPAPLAPPSRGVGKMIVAALIALIIAGGATFVFLRYRSRFLGERSRVESTRLASSSRPGASSSPSVARAAGLRNA